MGYGRFGAIFRAAWPDTQVDRLLRAAMLEDAIAAAIAWREFEASADFDHLTSGEMRLIGMAAKGLAGLAPDSSMLPRIQGIERANWSRSQLAIGEAGFGLRALDAASVDMLVIKGATRSASGDASARGRMLNDVDIVVRPDDMKKAFEILTDDGWRPAGSGSVIYQSSRLKHAVGINLVRGRFGNLDLHRTPFHPPYELIGDDASIWERSEAGSLANATVQVPCATDAIAISMAHGALDAHKSSDWLADIASGIDKGVDWALLETIVDRGRLHAAAAIALGYVGERLERTVPVATLRKFEKDAIRRPSSLLAALAETRPKARKIGVFWLLRAVAKQGRLLRTHRRSSDRRRVILPSPLAFRRPAATGVKFLQQPLELPDRAPGEAWSGSLDVTICVDLPSSSRRADFEINSKMKHHVRLRAVVLDRGKRDRLVRFKFPLSVTSDESTPVLAAVASRSFNAGASQELIDRYGARPFEIVTMKTKKSAP
jgi:hypothetical protein